MINNIGDIEWDKVRSYTFDRDREIITEILLYSGIRFDVDHLNISEQNAQRLMGHQPMTQQYDYPTQNYGNQDGQGNIGQGLSNAAQNAANGTINLAQIFILVFFTALGSFAAFSFYLGKRLVVNKLDMTIVDLFVNTRENFSKIFGNTATQYFPEVTMKSDVLIFDQVSTIIAFCILGIPLVVAIFKKFSKALWIALFYVVSMFLIASLYNLGVSKDFLDVMGSFPPLISISPFDLFGYLGK